jgi:hypothetical protein
LGASAQESALPGVADVGASRAQPGGRATSCRAQSLGAEPRAATVCTPVGSAGQQPRSRASEPDKSLGSSGIFRLYWQNSATLCRRPPWRPTGYCHAGRPWAAMRPASVRRTHDPHSHSTDTVPFALVRRLQGRLGTHSRRGLMGTSGRVSPHCRNRCR